MDIKNFHIPIIAASIIIAFLSNFGSFLSVIEPFTFLKMDFNSLERGYLNFFSIESTYNTNNEWWRLITPMLIHFSVAHLVFNCLWIYVLGSKIELLDGHFVFASLVIFCSICSNLTQYFFGGPSLFGGLSGVVYGMLGFCMIIELETQTQNLTIIRIGLVMSAKGGILSNIVPSVRFCLGSAFGSGNQWQSWIHIDDLAGIFLHVIKNNLRGTINAVAPNPVTQNQLMKSLGKHLNRPIILPNIPKSLVKLILGDRSQLVLSSQKISSRKIEASGFNFEFRDFENAIKDLKIK